jgi:hypothetical protein
VKIGRNLAGFWRFAGVWLAGRFLASLSRLDGACRAGADASFFIALHKNIALCRPAATGTLGVPMAERFLPEKIKDFLIQRPGRRYCDSCIQERLGLRWRQQVQLATATLAVTRSFVRDRTVCCTCNETKHVITAVQTPAVEALPRPRTKSSASPNTTRSASKLVFAHRSR